MKSLGLLGIVLSSLLACAPTTASDTPTVEVLMVLDGVDRSLTIHRTDAPDSITRIPILNARGTPTTLATNGRKAVVGLGDGYEIVIIDLVDLSQNSIPLGDIEGTISSVGFSDDGRVYAATESSGFLIGIDPFTGEILRKSRYLAGPRSIVTARGRLFVLFGPRGNCPHDGPICTAQASWLSHFSDAPQLDSIPMHFGGNPMGAVLAQDGTLYVLNRGGDAISGSLSAIDPIHSVQTAIYTSAFGLAPSYIAFDGIDRILVASKTDGLMVFNTIERRVERGAGSGIPLPGIPRALVTDAAARIYVVEAPGCGGTVQGRVRVFGRDLVERTQINVGSCPTAAVVTEIPVPPQ